MDIKASEKKPQKNKEVKELHDPVKQKLWIGGYFLLGAGCLLLYFLFRLKTFDIIGSYKATLLKLLLAGATAFGLLIIARFIQGVVTKRSHTRAIQYNMIRLIRLITIIIIAFIFITYLNANWYTAAVSLGLISFITWVCIANTYCFINRMVLYCYTRSI